MVAVCIRFFSFNVVLEHEQMWGNEHSGPLRLLTSPFVSAYYKCRWLNKSYCVTLHESETVVGF
jgi:hypothetical protein